MTIDSVANRAQEQRSISTAVRRALGYASVSALTLAASLAAGTAFAQEASEASTPAAAPAGATTETLGEVTVTGTRIVRDGYEAPTPVSVLGADQLQAMATTTIADSVNRLPAFAGSVTPRTISSNVGTGTAGVNALNLRGLGANRTLTLLDGKRMIGSSLGTGGNASAVDTNSFPTGLIDRVEVVTGGASAVYGSDALAGVVNFVLNKTYEGVKGTVEYGATQAGDGQNGKVNLTAGTAFADGRGHLLFSGEYTDDEGVIGNNRSWADDSVQLMNNPNAAQPGQPQLLIVHQAGVANGTRGGLVLGCRAAGATATNTNCALRGTEFVEGGEPIKFNFGPLVNGPIMSGGDWERSRVDRTTTLALPLTRRTAFGRGSFDITDNLNAFVELQYSYSKSHNKQVVPNLNQGGGVLVQSGNPFIPASVQAQMTALNVQTIDIGTFNGDLPYLQGINNRELKREVVGLEGDYDLFGNNFKWDTYFAHSEQDIVSETPGDRINANYALAIDAVVDPATGRIVCRSTLTNTTNGCVPYNPMGLGVNSKAAVNYVVGKGHSNTLLKQDAFSIGTSGEPFDDWAGPVSIAVGGEWRKESVEGSASALDEANAFFAGNYHATKGDYNVKEVFLETVVPLLKDVPGAEKLDFNGAVRYTDYSTSGNVTTWKAGATWEPIQDVRFRATRSRDIRAPNLGELFNAGQTGTGNNVDPFLGNSAYFMKSLTSGNRNLKPEEADTTGLGVVLSPRFLSGFTMSIDYYKIDITGAIATFSTTDILNQCFAGVQTFCSLITRFPTVGGQLGQVDIIGVQPTNVLGQVEEGVDLDASYNIPLPVGDLRLRGMMSYLTKLETADIAKGYTVNGRGINSADAGIGLGTGLSAPRGRYLVSVTYALDPVTVGLTMRGITSGVYNNLFVECDIGSCPAANTLPIGHNTINENHIDAIQYYDLSVNYKLGWGEVYGVLENALNEDPPTVAGGRSAGFYQGQSSSSLYDRFGRAYHVGFKFNF